MKKRNLCGVMAVFVVFGLVFSACNQGNDVLKPDPLSVSASLDDSLLKCNEIISYCSINSSKTNDGIRNATNGLKTDLSADYKVYKKEWTGSSTFVIDDINAKISRLD